jgi:streptogramin lyase
MSLAVNGGTPAKANLTTGSPNCTTPQSGNPTCTLSVDAPVGRDTFLLTLYDAPGATGNVLSTKMLAQTIALNAANTIALALDGVVASIAISPGAATLPAGATATVPLAVNALDAQANIIVGSGNYVDVNGSALTINLAAAQQQPAVTTPYTAGAAAFSAASVTNPAAPVTIAYDGKALLSTQFTATVTGGVAIAPASATLNLTPTMYEYPTTSTGSGPFSLAVGPDKQIWVSLFGVPAVEHFVPPAPGVATLNATTIPLPIITNDEAYGLAAGSDGNMWIASWGFDLFVCSVTGTCSVVPVNAADHPIYLVDGGDGNMYVNQQYFDGPQRYSITGQSYQSDFGIGGGYQMFVGPDGRIWSAGRQGGCCSVPSIVAVPTMISSNPSTTVINMDHPMTNVAVGPDGNIWFIEAGAGIVGHLTSLTSSSQTGIEIHLPGSGFSAIAPGPDGNMYFTDVTNNAIGRVLTSGTTVADITEYPVPTPNASLRDLLGSPDGNIWFVESGVDKIAKLAL